MKDSAADLFAAYLRQQKQLGTPGYIFTDRADPIPLPQHTAHTPSPVEEAPTGTAPQPPRQRKDPKPSPEPVQAESKQPQPASTDHREEADQRYARKRKALAELFYAYRSCQRCGLGALRTKFVFGAGNADASLLIIGEAPGFEEDRQGLPFVGPAGELLTKMLAAINLERSRDVFITNVLKCRPPQNRDPESAEVLACSQLLKRQVEIIDPVAILLLGRIAAQEMLATTGSIAVMRREMHTIAAKPAIVTYHPAALLRQPQYKRPAWQDLQKLETILKEHRRNEQ